MLGNMENYLKPYGISDKWHERSYPNKLSNLRYPKMNPFSSGNLIDIQWIYNPIRMDRKYAYQENCC